MNTCTRCSRPLKDINAVYGWRCALYLINNGGFKCSVIMPKEIDETIGGFIGIPIIEPL